MSSTLEPCPFCKGHPLADWADSDCYRIICTCMFYAEASLEVCSSTQAHAEHRWNQIAIAVCSYEKQSTPAARAGDDEKTQTETKT